MKAIPIITASLSRPDKIKKAAAAPLFLHHFLDHNPSIRFPILYNPALFSFSF